MNVNDIAQIIGTLGFPIVACAALFYQNWKVTDHHKEEVAELRKSQDETNARLVEAIQNNTLALSVLSTKIEVFGGDSDNG